MFRRRRR